MDAVERVSGDRQPLYMALNNHLLYNALPLSSYHRQLRLLELLPRACIGTVSCHLTVCDLAECPSYLALSYTWGEPNEGCEILVNGLALAVRNNLRDFLMQATEQESYDQWSSKFFWIDAISIDQSSNFERNHQVAIMREIYSKASKVVVWLGSGGSGSDVAIKRLATPVDFSTYRNLYLHDDGIHVLALLSRPYWIRAWIVQELLMAVDIEIICGKERVPWKQLQRHFHDVSYALESYASGSFVLWETIFDSPAFVILRLYIAYGHLPRQPEGKGFNLQRLLTTFAQLHCQDTRDRVYAGLGLMEPYQLGTFRLRVDYAESAAALYARLIAVWCHTQQLTDYEVDNFSNLLRTVLDVRPEHKIDNAMCLLPMNWLEACKALSNCWSDDHVERLLQIDGNSTSSREQTQANLFLPTVELLEHLGGLRDTWTLDEHEHLVDEFWKVLSRKSIKARRLVSGRLSIDILRSGKSINVQDLHDWEVMIGSIRVDIQKYRLGPQRCWKETELWAHMQQPEFIPGQGMFHHS